MPNAYLQGIQKASDNQAQIRNDVHAVAINWFVNRCPLVTRLPRVPVGSTTFTMVKRAVRSRQATLAASVVAGDSQISLVDASPFMNGDVLELNLRRANRDHRGPQHSDERGDRPSRSGRNDAGHRRGKRCDPAHCQQPYRRRDQPERYRVQAGGRCSVLPDVPASRSRWVVRFRRRRAIRWRPVCILRSSSARWMRLQNLMDDMEVFELLRARRGPGGIGSSQAEGGPRPADQQSYDVPDERGGLQADRSDPRHAGAVPRSGRCRRTC